MKIKLSSVYVEDQDKALDFYTNVLGFEKKTEIPMGEAKWLTVFSPEGHEDVELVLEPNSLPVAKDYQKALFEQGIPSAAFEVDDIAKEHATLSMLGVQFKMEPTKMGDATLAIFDDTCGNLIQIYQS